MAWPASILHLSIALHASTLCSPSPLTNKLEPEIKRFGKVLKWISRFEPLFIFMPISKVRTH